MPTALTAENLRNYLKTCRLRCNRLLKEALDDIEDDMGDGANDQISWNEGQLDLIEDLFNEFLISPPETTDDSR